MYLALNWQRVCDCKRVCCEAAVAFKSSLMAGVLSMIGACIDCLLSYQVRGHRQHLSLTLTVDD